MSVGTEAPQRPYFVNLEGLRFFAFLLVFVSHVARFVWEDALFLSQGDLGVSFFFTLSGFLITYLLFFEKESIGTIHLKSFYLRRVLRIWPLYFLIFGLGILTASIAFENNPFIVNFNPDSTWWFVAFLANFWLIAYRGMSTMLVVLWSISVEEQFYLVWPLVMQKIRTTIIPWFLFVIIVVATVFRFIYSENYKMVSYSTFSVMSDLAIGALLSYMAFYLPHLKEKLVTYLSAWKIGAMYLVFLGLVILKIYAYDIIPESIMPLYIAIVPIIFSILFAFVIFEQNYSSSSLFKAGSSRLINYFGKISYGLYMYHVLAITLAIHFLSKISIDSKVLVTVLSLVLTILLSHISYQYMEKKFLALKDRLK